MGCTDPIIAVDGFSSCGKSTFARAIAARLGLAFIDTGAMYRAVTLARIRKMDRVEIEFRFNESTKSSDIYLNGENVEGQIRSLEVSNAVSAVSAEPAVREKLVCLQQKMGEKGGVVMDGRDIGTVVFPEADIKIFMTASPEVRARRRYAELLAKGEQATLDEVLNNLVRRDEADTTRAHSPLRRADDAVVLDNSDMTVEQQLTWFDKLYRERCGSK